MTRSVVGFENVAGLQDDILLALVQLVATFVSLQGLIGRSEGLVDGSVELVGQTRVVPDGDVFGQLSLGLFVLADGEVKLGDRVALEKDKCTLNYEPGNINQRTFIYAFI